MRDLAAAAAVIDDDDDKDKLGSVDRCAAETVVAALLLACKRSFLGLKRTETEVDTGRDEESTMDDFAVLLLCKEPMSREDRRRPRRGAVLPLRYSQPSSERASSSSSSLLLLLLNTSRRLDRLLLLATGPFLSFKPCKLALLLGLSVIMTQRTAPFLSRISFVGRSIDSSPIRPNSKSETDSTD